MATEGTVQLSKTHAPHRATINALKSVLEILKDELVKLGHDHNRIPHPELSPRAVKHVSDSDLTYFPTHDLGSVGVADSAYGLHLFWKIRLPTVPWIKPTYTYDFLGLQRTAQIDGNNRDERGYNAYTPKR
jgi:hypothetical protein